MTWEEELLLREYLVELGEIDGDLPPSQQAVQFEEWYTCRQRQVEGEVYYKHILAGAWAWKRAAAAGVQPELL